MLAKRFQDASKRSSPFSASVLPVAEAPPVEGRGIVIVSTPFVIECHSSGQAE